MLALDLKMAMATYTVLFFWPLDLEGDAPRVFVCDAAGKDDAERLCLERDPDCEVVFVHGGSDIRAAKREWARNHRFNPF